VVLVTERLLPVTCAGTVGRATGLAAFGLEVEDEG
jgi:hypothetical protein